MSQQNKNWLDSLDLVERDLLAIVVAHNTEYEPVLEALTVEHFSSPICQHIFSSALSLYSDYKGPIDTINLADKLRERFLSTYNNIGGASGLLELSILCPEAPNTEVRINDIQKRFKVKQISKLSNEMVELSKNVKDPDSLVALFEQKVKEMDDLGSADTSSLFSVQDIAPSVYDHIYEFSKRKEGELIGLSTGIRDLDHILLGLQPNRLIILGARPAMGKTALALQIANYVGYNNVPVLFFSLEMGKEELMQRLLATEAEIPFRAIQTANLTEDLWYKISVANAKIKRSQLIIDDEPLSSIATLRIKINKFKRKNGGQPPKLIIIDYLQLMEIEGKYKGNSTKAQDVSEISRALHLISKEFDCTVLALSQLSRSNKDRNEEKRRPVLTDLRDSGSIEQDGHTIMFLHRDEHYNPAGPNQGIAELIIAKHRSGELATIKLAFIEQYTKFENLSRTTSI